MCSFYCKYKFQTKISNHAIQIILSSFPAPYLGTKGIAIRINNPFESFKVTSSPPKINIKKHYRYQFYSAYKQYNTAADGTRTHMVSRTILSRMRLPIPPQRHKEVSHKNYYNELLYIIIYLFYCQEKSYLIIFIIWKSY